MCSACALYAATSHHSHPSSTGIARDNVGRQANVSYCCFLDLF
jgi:hypothetical protein